MKSVPLKWIKSVDVRHEKGGVVFALTLSDDDADAVTNVADGADFVTVFAKQSAVAGAACRRLAVVAARSGACSAARWR